MTWLLETKKLFLLVQSIFDEHHPNLSELLTEIKSLLHHQKQIIRKRARVPAHHLPLQIPMHGGFDTLLILEPTDHLMPMIR